MHIQTLFAGAAACLAIVEAQLPVAKPFSTSFNSSFELSEAQIQAASLDPTSVNSINTILNFERSRLANGGPRQDDFYTLPPRPKGTLKPGQVLKIQKVTDPTPFSIASGSSLSRILYTTRDANGTVLPASAYILWPYIPRQYGSSAKGKAAAVLWAHGTSGYFADAAPSAYRNLYYESVVPLALAEAGYAIIAPDYAGLGVSKDWDGNIIPHQYFAVPAGAQDTLYAMQAAITAFDDRLTGKFAIAGHSQGGSIAWATAELLATPSRLAEFKDLIKNYVGTISFAPVTKVWIGPFFAKIMVAFRLSSIYPDFKLEDWLKPLGLDRVKLLEEIQGSTGLVPYLLSSAPEEDIIRPTWYNSSYHARAFEELADLGNKPLRGPLLVVQGTNDWAVMENDTTAAVANVCGLKNSPDLEYYRIKGFGHTPTIAATRSLWQRWLEDRFNGKVASKGCKTTDIDGWLGDEAHFTASNGFFQWAGAPEFLYQVAGAN
jgi:pimeloyl-ACP methyl ester carboxylesterase